MPVVPAASRTESVLLAAAQELDGKNRPIADLRQTIVERDESIYEHVHVNNEQRSITRLELADTEKQHTIDDLRRIIAELQGDVDERGHKRARLNEQALLVVSQAQQLAAMAAPATRPPVDAQLATTVAVQDGSTTDDSATDDNTHDSDSALDCNDVLADSIAGDEDNCDHATVHTDTTPHSAAMGSAAPRNDTACAISGLRARAPS
ncbi:hypothetical protein H4S03_002808 [Coemansia sp. S3946]|nr:hypothetical protein H4S03_002808 [Coemansia sp. S3946]